MKKRVRIYKPENQWKAQMGGYQATEAAAPQAQLTDEDLISATVKMLAQGSQPQEVLNSLMENGIEEQKATQAVQYSVDYIQNIQDEEYSDVEADTQLQDDIALEEAAAQRQAIEAQEAEARKARMQELYGLTDDNTTQDYSDDDQLMMDMMRYGGLPSKRTYVKNAVKLAKKQMGGQDQPGSQSNRADNTDTGDRTDKLKKFVGSLQNHANEALMKLDAEEAYNQMQEQNPFMAMAQEGGEDMAAQLNPRQQRQMARQQRQMGRQMNRMIGNIPVGLYNNRGGGLPTNIGVINMPAIGTAGLQSLMQGASSMMQGAGSIMPAMGSMIGGPKLANIDVRKTGLFGRPKQYSITFAQDVVTNPVTAENAAKQEIKNAEEEVKETEEKVEAAADEVKKSDEAVKAEEAATTKSTSGTSSKTTAAAKKKTTPVKSASYTESQLDADSLKLVQDFQSLSSPKKFAYLNKMRNHPDFNTNPAMKVIYDTLYGLSPFQDEEKKPATEADYQNFLSKTNPTAWQYSKPQSIQSSVQLFDNYRVPYWMAKEAILGKDTETENYEGRAAIKHSLASINPLASLFFQQGGFTDQQSGLYKFVYGGNDMYMPAPAGKITDDPYFQYGGLKRYAEGDEVTTTGGSGTEESDTKNLKLGDKEGYYINPETGKSYTDEEWANRSTTETNTDVATTTAKTPDYSINPMTGKAWTDAEWAMASKLLGNVTSGATAETETDASTDAQTNTGYNYGYNTGVGPIYPPLFNRGRGLQNLLNFTPFGANPIATYAGTWTQQKGLPFDPATGQAYSGDFANPQIAKIDVRKSGLLGRPKKYTIDYLVDDEFATGTTPAGTIAGTDAAAAQTATGQTATTGEEATEAPVGGREIKNYKMKEFMSRIPGVRRMINWGDAPEMTPEEEADFKYRQEVARNTAAEESGDIEAPPIPEDQAAAQQTPSSMDPMLASRMEAKDNAFYEEMEGVEAPPIPGETQSMTGAAAEAVRRQMVEDRQQPLLQGVPTGTREEVERQLEQQAYADNAGFMNQAGPMQNIDAAVAGQFGVPQSMVDQFAYQADDNTDGSVFDLSTQRGFDKQQYLNESLGREKLDVNQRPITGTLPINSLEQLYTDMTPGEIVQSPQYKADNETIIAELTKQGKPITQANIMQEFGRQLAGQSVRQQQAEAAAAAKAAAPKKSAGKVNKQIKNSVGTKGTTTSGKTSNFNRNNSWENNYQQSAKDKFAKVTMLEFGSDVSEYKKMGLSDSEIVTMTKNAIKDMDKLHPTFIDTYFSLRPADRLQYIDHIKTKYGVGSQEMLALKGMASGAYSIPKKKHGGLHKAYDGVQTPVSGDPRFASSYEEMMRNIAAEESGELVPPPIPGENTTNNFAKEAAEATRKQMLEDMGEPYFRSDTPKKKRVSVEYKNKNMWTIDPQQALNAGLMGAQGLTRFLNTRDERKREQELARSLTADNVYGTRSNMDRGTYDVNSGLFREMGFNGVVKYGGAPFKQGGTTYMSAAQVKRFLEEGGELEFV